MNKGNLLYVVVMTLCDWASWLIKKPEFSLSNDWLTFLLGVQITEEETGPKLFEEYKSSPSTMVKS